MPVQSENRGAWNGRVAGAEIDVSGTVNTSYPECFH